MQLTSGSMLIIAFGTNIRANRLSAKILANSYIVFICTSKIYVAVVLQQIDHILCFQRNKFSDKVSLILDNSSYTFGGFQQTL